MDDRLQNAVATGATAAFVALTQPGVVQATTHATDVPDPVRSSLVDMTDAAHEAIVEGISGSRQGKDAANAEQVAAAESSEQSPPEPDLGPFSWESLGESLVGSRAESDLVSDAHEQEEAIEVDMSPQADDEIAVDVEHGDSSDAAEGGLSG